MNFARISWICHPKHRQQKQNKGGYIKLKNLCTSKETMNRMKKKPTEQEKIAANHISDKGLISIQNIIKGPQLNN